MQDWETASRSGLNVNTSYWVTYHPILHVVNIYIIDLCLTLYMQSMTALMKLPLEGAWLSLHLSNDIISCQKGRPPIRQRITLSAWLTWSQWLLQTCQLPWFCTQDTRHGLSVRQQQELCIYIMLLTKISIFPISCSIFFFWHSHLKENPQLVLGPVNMVKTLNWFI